MVKLRLHQVLSKSGAFRTKDEVMKAIRNNEIKIRTEIINNPNYRVDTKETNVYYNEERLEPARKVYFLFNKPKRISCQKNEPKSIYNIIEKELKVDEATRRSCFTVGRLDVDSSGLIIITNDGMLASKISNPKNHIKKSYQVLLDRDISDWDLKRLDTGVTILLDDKDYRTRPAKAHKIGPKEVIITIKEGKKRQIRRMFGALGYTVKELKRISIGKIKLEKLGLRQFKEIPKDEIYDKLFKD
ncbi:MAG: pseudouridine synthase [Candidatus Nanoarchaeia archaeon]